MCECVCVAGEAGIYKSRDGGAERDRWRAEDKDEGRTEGERRELPPLVISAGKGV